MPGEATPGSENPLPRAGTLIPQNGDVTDESVVSLEWFPTAGAASYRVQLTIETDAAFAKPILDVNATEPFADTPALTPGRPDVGYALHPLPHSQGRDFDADGKATELDPDSDDGGCVDGVEDENRDGHLTGRETWNFQDEDDACRNVKATAKGSGWTDVCVMAGSGENEESSGIDSCDGHRLSGTSRAYQFSCTTPPAVPPGYQIPVWSITGIVSLDPKPLPDLMALFPRRSSPAQGGDAGGLRLVVR